MKLMCSKCGYNWDSKSDMFRVSCPQCGNKVLTNTGILEKKEENNPNYEELIYQKAREDLEKEQEIQKTIQDLKDKNDYLDGELKISNEEKDKLLQVITEQNILLEEGEANINELDINIEKLKQNDTSGKNDKVVKQLKLDLSDVTSQLHATEQLLTEAEIKNNNLDDTYREEKKDTLEIDEDKLCRKCRKYLRELEVINKEVKDEI